LTKAGNLSVIDD